MELSGSNVKKFLLFCETKTLKKFYILHEIELPYILGNGNPKKLIFQESTLRARKIKKKKLTF